MGLHEGVSVFGMGMKKAVMLVGITACGEIAGLLLSMVY